MRIMSDKEMKSFLKKIEVDVSKIDHLYGLSGTCLACVACKYMTDCCWLCKHCVSCCTCNVKHIFDGFVFVNVGPKPAALVVT